MPTLTLTTDFGIKDGNVGVMKGVIWRICPEAQIADLSHTIQPQNVPEAALILFRSAPYFPKDTIHVVVVDPGVGTARRPIAARIGGQYFVCPDNGVLTMTLERAGQEGWPVEIVHLDKPQYWLNEISHVFHGRDIFAPCAAHLASGVPLHALGTPIHDPVKLALPKPQRTENGWRGEVIHVDHFGNVASNIRVEHLGNELSHKERIVVRVGGVEIRGLVNTFGERPIGELIALLGSTGNLIVSVVNGSAADRLKVKVGDLFETLMFWSSPRSPRSLR
ncbi:MAG: SAM-dependent chlorinase/fluorinase [Anaerolineales bacterium]|nr:SAM-dependent chlorinase/fluorinase [Anaerolineales bacterium]